MDQIFVKPAPGLQVRDPYSRRPLAETGEFKPIEMYWLRRLADGDVVEAEPVAETKE